MKKIPIILFSVIGMTWGLTGCKSESHEFTEEDKQAITKTSIDAVSAFNITKDLNAYVNAYYTEDATVLMANNEPVIGRKEILDLYKTFGDVKLEFKIVEITGKDDLAYVYGKYTTELSLNGDKDFGKYVEIWRKKEGKWKVVYDISNTSVPLTGE